MSFNEILCDANTFFTPQKLLSFLANDLGLCFSENGSCFCFQSEKRKVLNIPFSQNEMSKNRKSNCI